MTKAPPSAKKCTPPKQPALSIGNQYAMPTLRSKPNGAGEAGVTAGAGAGGGLKKGRTGKAEETNAAHESTGLPDRRGGVQRQRPIPAQRRLPNQIENLPHEIM